MKKIALISFQENIDVSKAVTELWTKYPDATFLLPCINYDLFTLGVLKVLGKKKAKVKLFLLEGLKLDYKLDPESVLICLDPLKEVFKELEINDVLGIVWDNSPECHVALASVEDFGLETWDITDGLSEIEIDYLDSDGSEKEMLLQNVLDKGEELAEAITAYVTMDVLDVLSDTIMARMKEEEDTKDINPFKDGE